MSQDRDETNLDNDEMDEGINTNELSKSHAFSTLVPKSPIKPTENNLNRFSFIDLISKKNDR